MLLRPYVQKLIKTEYDAKKQVVWRPTSAGLAAHRSSLPLLHAVTLHKDLSEMAREGVCLVCKSTGRSLGHLHLLFLCVHRDTVSDGNRNPFGKLVWTKWYSGLSVSKNQHIRELGNLVGVTEQFAQKMMRSGGGNNKDAKERDRHARLAAASALHDLLDGRDARDVAKDWDELVDSTTPLGTGQLQQLQADTAANAAMASNLATTAGWHNIGELLAQLARELDSGVKRELSGLMAVAQGGSEGWVMTAPRARALFRAGLKTPESVAKADEVNVRKAMERATQRSAGTAAGGDRGAGATVGWTRVARDIIRACLAYEKHRHLELMRDASGHSDDEDHLQDDDKDED